MKETKTYIGELKGDFKPSQIIGSDRGKETRIGNAEEIEAAKQWLAPGWYPVYRYNFITAR